MTTPILDDVSTEVGASPRTSMRAHSARPRRRWGRFAAEGVLIVLSVLLALAVGEWRDWLRDRHLARAALANFRREIAGNLAQLERAQPKHAAMARRLADASAAATAGTAFDAFVAAMPDSGMDTEPLREVAWETAQTTGALRLLDYETAARLSETYLLQRAALQPTLQRLSDRFLAPDNFDATRRGAMLRTHRMMLVELSGQEAYLITVYRRALKALPAP